MKKNICIVILSFIILTMVFTFLYVRHESPIYVFDYSGYHQMYIQAGEQFFTNKTIFIKNLIESVRNLDYNILPIVPILPFYKIFQGERLGYILGLTLIYVIPVMVLTLILIKRFIYGDKKNLEKKEIAFLAAISIIVFLYTRYWAPTLRGLPDIVGLIPMAISGLIFLKYRFTDKIKKYIPIILGLSVYCEFLLRRWYAYSVVAYFVSLFIIELIRFIKAEKEEKKEKFLHALVNFSISGATMIITGCICQLPLIRRIIRENYATSYSAFQVEFIQHFINIINEFGWVVIILAFVGIIWTLSHKEHRIKGLFLILNLVICYGSFIRVQAMGVHHFLSISLWIMILAAYGLYGLCKILKNKYVQVSFLTFIILLFGINFTTTFIKRNMKVSFISQNNKYCKFYYERFGELQKLINDVDVMITENGGKVSVLADTEVLSDNIVDLLGSQNIKNNIIYTSHIDLRDGLNFNSLMCEYIVVTDIPQATTNPDGQRILWVPNNEIYNNKSIGKAYKRVSGPYVLDNNVSAYIYRKERAFTQEEVDEYMEILYNYYPQWKEQYNKFDIASLAASRKLGNKLGDVRRYKYDIIYMSPGFDETVYSIPLNKKVKKMKIKVYIEGNVNVSDVTCGVVNLKIDNDNEVLYEKDVKFNEEDIITLDLENTDKLNFTADKSEYLNCDWLFIQIQELEF